MHCAIVEAPARLHLGFLDPSGGARCFGSLGLTLGEVSTVVRAMRAERFAVEGVEAERGERCLELMRRRFPLPHPVRIHVEQAIPPHAGLGSGTQLALAVGTAAARLNGIAATPRDLARVLDRGNRSGIGIGAFETGGFLVDGGRGRTGEPPSITSRLPFPPGWRVVLVFDRGFRGLYGLAEAAAFRALPALAETVSGHLCRLVLMRVLPALAEQNLDEFGAAVAEIQRIVGDHFAPAQGGRFASPGVAQALAFIESQRIACIGQSSWGPTGFAVVDSELAAHGLLKSLRARFDDRLSFQVCEGRNHGAAVRMESGTREASAR